MSLSFFFFIDEWLLYIKNALVVTSLDWMKISGYSVLFNKFLAYFPLLIDKNPEILKGTGKYFLMNKNLLGRMVMELIKNTNIRN